MRSLLSRIPRLVWLGPLALFLTLLPGVVWTGLLVANLSTSPTIPWAVVVMAPILWLMWQYAGGKWWPQSTSQARRRCLRARPVAGPVFAWAVAAGVLSIAALTGFWIVLFQLAKMQGNPVPDFSQYPAFTVALVVGMAALVGAVSEEAGIRGYFQGLLEQRVGGPLAILIAALVIAPGHGLTQGFAWPTVLFYLCGDAMFGITAYLTQSILPGIVVHFIGLVTFFTLIWLNDATRRLVGEAGTEPWFWIHVAQALVFTVLTILAFVRLARVTDHVKK
jgi:membrane protease YdiL (CAAX protease family)